MTPNMKILLSILGTAVAAGGTSLQTQPTAPWQMHAAVVGVAVGSYLMGLVQRAPKDEPEKK